MIGYELGAKIAKTAYLQKRPVIEVALELTDIDEQELRRLLDPVLLTRGWPDIDRKSENYLPGTSLDRKSGYRTRSVPFRKICLSGK